ncbi:hypothetical protein EV586_104237 [Tumebacillus sp. BK434]|uniref:hypothetical protein n=1 Tax=Tumebacillus sp. BK434 TaxID=2512169 RepID=UPI0010481532|nr:hypothetical protein [Tumebacillus sp. BK434]TCP54616.1 hypothetical protein EV586_104237 [Tumebacillus sp. BK434]
MSQQDRQPLIGPVITTPPGAVPPVIFGNPQLVPQPLPYPLQPVPFSPYYGVPYPRPFLHLPVGLYHYPHRQYTARTQHVRFFPAPIPPLFPPVYGVFPPLFPPVPPPIYPYPLLPIIF